MAMRWIPFALAALTASQYVDAKVYLSVEQAQQLMFPGTKLTQTPIVLTDDQRKSLEQRSGVHEPFRGERIWRSPTGDFFIVDEVVGKHEMIKYAASIGRDCHVQHVEILEYNESYGYEIREKEWLAQFEGKAVSAPVKLNDDIRNISGATLSSKHVTDGVRRLLLLHSMILKGLPG